MKKIFFRDFFDLLGRESITWLMFGVFASLSLAGLELCFATSLQLLIAKISNGSDTELFYWLNFLKQFTIGKLCIVLTLFGFFRGTLQIFTTQSGHMFDTTINTRLRNITIYDLMVSNRAKSVSASEINLKFLEIFPKTGAFISTVVFGFVAFIQVVSVGVACALMNWKLSLFGLISIVATGLMLLFVRKKVAKWSRALMSEQSKISKHLQKITRNWIFIKISRTGEQEYKHLLQGIKYYATSAKTLGFIIKFSGVFPTVVGIGIIALMIYIGHEVIGLKGAGMIGFIYLFYRFTQQFSAFIDSLVGGTNYFPHFQRSLAFFNSLPKIDKHKAFLYYKNNFVIDDSSLRLHRDLDAPHISIKNLHYSWNVGEELFKNFSLEINAGSICGIVGPSGSGKSSLLSLLLGVVTPNKGDIRINNTEPEEFFNLYSSRVGYVGPEPFLSEGTIKENLIYGLTKESWSDQKIKLALSLAQLSEYSDKLDYEISENGEGLSSGQKQRLSLARAFMKNPKLLILDEATSNLDHANERTIAEILKNYKGECTIIIVSHRPGILVYADNVIELNKGGSDTTCYATEDI